MSFKRVSPLHPKSETLRSPEYATNGYFGTPKPSELSRPLNPSDCLVAQHGKLCYPVVHPAAPHENPTMRHLIPIATFAVLIAAFLPPATAADDYAFGPDSFPHEGVPKGKVTQFKWDDSKIFEGTSRNCWVYVPDQYDSKTPACVMVFQDGSGYVDDKRDFRVPVVFDNLIHRKEMPVTVGIFINPGDFPATNKGGKARSNRSFEYDTPSNQYARFLEKEILPEVGKTIKLRTDAPGRAICGISSGGICAFTVAWERPDLFSKVLSHVGSFTNIRGGDVYPGLIRKTERKPIRVFLQDGLGDLDNLHGNWPLANLSMASSLQYMDYEYKLVFGDGGHNGKQGGVILPDSLRWLWRDTPPAP
jgi:enterochelin esterase-like enzyme